MNDSKILVPVKIEALIVDEFTTRDEWKNFSLNYSMMWDRVGPELETGDLKDLTTGLCEEGVHLHWALPAALTNGVYIGNKMVFPAVPNRWLIVRTYLNDKNVTTTKKWIVESDYVIDSKDKTLPKGTSPWVIENADGSFTPTSIGRKVDIDEKTVYKESKRPAVPLTAMGPGNPVFAAIYKSCRNVFGFFDNTVPADIKEGTFSYLITGWYSDPLIDPLNNSETKIKENLRNKWAVKSLPEGRYYPTETFCHGAIHSMSWEKKKRYKLPNKDAQVNVNVGYTSIEAISVQMAKRTGAAEKLLSAFFYDALKDIEGTAQIETEVDRRGFAGFDGGYLWEVQRTEKESQAKESKAQIGDFPGAGIFPGLSLLFRKLNLEQRNLDRLVEVKKSLLVEYRAVCDKVIKDKMVNKAPLYNDQLTNQKNELKENITAITGLITISEKNIGDYEKTIGANVAFAKESADGKTLKPEYELVRKKMPRFWKPNDPTIVLSGPGVTDSSKYNAEPSGILECRLVSEIVNKIIIRDGPSKEEKEMQPDIDLAIVPSGSLTPDNVDLIRKLFIESILLDPARAKDWAHKYYGDESRINQNAKDMAVSLGKILNTDVKDADNKQFTGVRCVDGIVVREPMESRRGLLKFLGEHSIQKWAHPWTPIYMIWYAKWIPSYKTGKGLGKFDSGKWTWKDKKYTYNDVKLDETNELEYFGKSILTDAITGMIQERLPENVKIDKNISQAMGSFSDSMVMRIQAIQLPLFREPAKDSSRKLLRDALEAPYLTNENYFFPDTNAGSNFFPVRAGHFQLTKLWVTDAFGQVQKIIDYNDQEKKVKINNNGSLLVAENLSGAIREPSITLTPRIIQPSRLLFRWINAKAKELEESTSDPSTHPVCGWIMPDYLGQCINVYETQGESCGSLRMIEATEGFTGNVRLEWQSAIGAKGATPDECIQNSYLRGFVNGLLDIKDRNDRPGGGLVVNLLFDLCNNISLFLNTPSTHQAPGVTGLIGQPVALVRAALKLELSGLPFQPQGWNGGLAQNPESNPPGLSDIEFPVSLGDTRNSKDGLIGYFTDKTGFGKMYTAYGTPDQRNEYFSPDDVTLTFNADASETAVTLLMDPRGGVHADCGILPSKFIDLPHTFISKGLKSIDFNLLIAPFLGAVSDPYIPVGIESDSNWVLRQKKHLKDEWTKTIVGSQKELSSGSINIQKAQEGYLTLEPVSQVKE